MSVLDRKLVDREIDGLNFTCQQSDWVRASELAPRAAALFSVQSDDVQATMLTAMAVFNRDRSLLGDLLAGTRVVLTENGKLVDISLATVENRNRAFTGRLATSYKAALFAAEVEFRDFFDGVFVAKLEDAETNEEEGSPSA